MPKDIIDIATELEETLREYGREMFLRQKEGQRCSCYDERALEADRECTSCSGFGWVYVDKKILALRQITTEMVSGAYRRPIAALGSIVGDEATIYFELRSQTTTRASEHDWIIECKTKSNGCLWQPYKIERIWDINEVIDHRDLHGQFSYYECRCRRLTLGK